MNIVKKLTFLIFLLSKLTFAQNLTEQLETVLSFDSFNKNYMEVEHYCDELSNKKGFHYDDKVYSENCDGYSGKSENILIFAEKTLSLKIMKVLIFNKSEKSIKSLKIESYLGWGGLSGTLKYKLISIELQNETQVIVNSKKFKPNEFADFLVRKTQVL